MGHSHDQDAGNISRVQIALALTGTFMVVEVVGGILSGSLALLADAGHMLTDSMALALAVFAFRVSSKPADGRRSYGYQRVQIIALINRSLKLIVSLRLLLFLAFLFWLHAVAVAVAAMMHL